MGLAMERRWLRHYAPGVPEEIPPPAGSLADLLDGAVSRFPDQTALEFFGAEVSYRELGVGVSEVAEGLRRLDVRAGDRVALVLPNCPEHILAFYAVLRLGAVVVEQNPLYTAEELSKTFADHGARIAIAWDKVVPSLRAMSGSHALEQVVAVDLTRSMPLLKRIALSLPIPKAKKLRAALSSPAPDALPFERLHTHGPSTPGTHALLSGTWPRSSTPRGRRACPRGRCSPTETWWPTPRRGEPGSRDWSTAARSSTRCSPCSTPTG